MTVVYEDNHIIVVNKTSSEIVQGDKTGDTPLSETVKSYLKENLLGDSERVSERNGRRIGSLFGPQ